MSKAENELERSVTLVNDRIVTNINNIMKELNEVLDTEVKYSVVLKNNRIAFYHEFEGEYAQLFISIRHILNLVNTTDILRAMIEGLSNEMNHYIGPLREELNKTITHLNSILESTIQINKVFSLEEGQHRFFKNPNNLFDLAKALIDHDEIDYPININGGLYVLDSGEIEVKELAEAIVLGADPFCEDLEDIILAAQDHGYPFIREMIKEFGEDTVITMIRNNFEGEYDSEEDFAKEQAVELGKVDESMICYVDWKRYSSLLFANDYRFIDGKVFKV